MNVFLPVWALVMLGLAGLALLVALGFLGWFFWMAVTMWGNK